MRAITLKVAVAIGVALALGACTHDGEGDNGSTPASTTGAPVGSATLLPSVKVIDSTQADYFASSTDTTWTLRAPNTIKSGDVLLLQDAAVKVVSVDTSSGQMVLTVTLAQIEEVFSELHIKQTIDLSNATFTPDPTSSIPATLHSTASGSASVAAPVSGSATLSLNIPVNKPPWTANLEFTFVATFSLDYDNSSQTGLTGFLDATGSVDGNAQLVAQRAFNADLVEVSLGTIDVPLRLNVIGSVLVTALKIRLQIPVSVGAKSKVDVALTLGVEGSGQAQGVTKYDANNGFAVSGPTFTGRINLTGSPTDIPTAPLKASVMLGPYVRARPQLSILNSVASMGAQVDVGLYGKGTIEAILASPYVCMSLNPVLQGSGLGFFKSILGSFESSEVTDGFQVGAPFLYPASGERACNTVEFDNASYTVSQQDGSATITVTRDGDTSQVATVNYVTSDGTAVAGRDYTAVSGTLTFNPNDPSETFSIPLLNTATSQGGTVKLKLNTPSSEISLGTPSTATLMIIFGFDGTYSFAATVGDPPCTNTWTNTVQGTEVDGFWTVTCGGNVAVSAGWSGTLTVVSPTQATITGSGTLVGYDPNAQNKVSPRPFTLENAYINTDDGELCWQATDPLGIYTLQSCSPKVQ